jgi:excisionase family DNA binding protein
MSDDRILLKPREAAASLGISARLLWSMTKAEQIPHVRIGRLVRYSTTSLQEWIAKIETGKQPEMSSHIRPTRRNSGVAQRINGGGTR